MLKAKIWLYALTVVLGISFASIAQARSETVGVVILHGKWGSPGKLNTNLADKLEREGFLVATPEMPWSGTRLYDKGIDGAMIEIDAAVKTLHDKGAKKIFMAGHSLGAAAVLRYGTRTAVDGLILLAPGHYPEGKVFKSKMESDVLKAKEMIQANKGDDLLSFVDLNSGSRKKTVDATAKTFLEYFDPVGPMNSQNNAASIRAGLPVLWVVGTNEEEGLKRMGTLARGKIPENPGHRFVEVDSDHMNTPNDAVEAVITWIKDIIARQ
jgi:alpha-beta hydrolase superfamily lysophospholipase